MSFQKVEKRGGELCILGIVQGEKKEKKKVQKKSSKKVQKKTKIENYFMVRKGRP